MRVVGSLYLDGTTIKLKNSTANGATNIVAGSVASGADINITLPLWSTTFLATAATSITLPTTGTLATLAGAEALTNKTLTSPKINENVALTTTSTILNLLTSAAGTTGTTSTNIVFSTSPTLVTPVLGVATATTINGLTITTSAAGVLTIAASKTLSVSNTLTFTGTDTSSVAFGTGGTVAYVGSTLAQFASTTSLELKTLISDETGSGALVFADSPVFTTPNIGSATGSISGNAATVTTNANLTGHILSTGNAAVLGSFTSAHLLAALTDETGTGANVFGTSPTLVTPTIDDYLILNEESTPGTAGAGTVRIYAKSDKKIYKKDSNGTESELGAGGTSLINYISNADLETGATTGWATYKDAAAATPVDGTGGSPTTLTLSANSSSPMRGSYDFKVVKSAADSQGEGFSYDFTIKTPDKSKKLSISFDLTSNDSNFTAGDVVIYVYDVTNAALITPSSTSLPKVGASTYNVTFDSTTSTSYRLIFHWAVTTATAVSLYFDSFIVGPGTITQGAAVSDGTSYTLTIGGVTAAPTPGTSTSKAVYTRVGSMMRLTYTFNQTSTSGSAGGTGSYLFPLPSGFTIDSTKLGNIGTAGSSILGVATIYNGSTTLIGAILPYSTSNLMIQVMNDTTAPALVSSTFYQVSTNATLNYSFEATIPIAEWAGNGTVNLGAGAQVEYASNYSTGTGNDTGSFAYGPAGSAIPSVTAASNKKVRFQYPIQSDDILVIELSKSGGPWAEVAYSGPSNYVSNFQYQDTKTYGIGVNLDTSTTTEVDVYFGTYAGPNGATYAANGLAWSTIAATYKWRVRKSKASSPVGFGLAANGESGLINYYYAYDHTTTWTWNGSGGTSGSTTIKVTRNGRLVTLFFDSIINATSGTSSDTLTSDTALPSWARPAAGTIYFMSILGQNNGSPLTAASRMQITTAGLIAMLRDGAGGAFSNSATCGFYPTAITYTV